MIVEYCPLNILSHQRIVDFHLIQDIHELDVHYVQLYIAETRERKGGRKAGGNYYYTREGRQCICTHVHVQMYCMHTLTDFFLIVRWFR